MARGAAASAGHSAGDIFPLMWLWILAGLLLGLRWGRAWRHWTGGAGRTPRSPPRPSAAPSWAGSSACSRAGPGPSSDPALSSPRSSRPWPRRGEPSSGTAGSTPGTTWNGWAPARRGPSSCPCRTILHLAGDLPRVQPRVISPSSGEAVLLHDEIGLRLDRGERGAIAILGGPGSGKTTAIRHLREVLPSWAAVGLVDSPASPEVPMAAHAREHLLIFTTPGKKLPQGLAGRLPPGSLEPRRPDRVSAQAALVSMRLGDGPAEDVGRRAPPGGQSRALGDRPRPDGGGPVGHRRPHGLAPGDRAPAR